MWLFVIRLLSRVTSRVTILSEGGMEVPAIFIPVKGGKLHRLVEWWMYQMQHIVAQCSNVWEIHANRERLVKNYTVVQKKRADFGGL